MLRFPLGIKKYLLQKHHNFKKTPQLQKKYHERRKTTFLLSLQNT